MFLNVGIIDNRTSSNGLKPVFTVLAAMVRQQKDRPGHTDQPYNWIRPD